jgi:hypothetical protein
MKLIFGFLLFVATVAVTGGLYLVIRKEDDKKCDLQRLYSLPSQIAKRVQSLGDYLFNLFGSKPEASEEHPGAGVTAAA